MISRLSLSESLEVHHISYHEGAVTMHQLSLQGAPIRGDIRILASTGSANLVLVHSVSGEHASTLRLQSLFPDGVYKEGEEGAHRLGAVVNQPSSQSSDPSLRTSQRECDTITFLRVL